ncbi:hypothetical protein [uncultured Methanoregula sp.]|nr:hypothetical protein [uncultured Methanoregula sp.]
MRQNRKDEGISLSHPRHYPHHLLRRNRIHDPGRGRPGNRNEQTPDFPGT